MTCAILKTMQQMQDEMLKKARFDGGYPRPVIMPIGVLALAKNEKQYKEMKRFSQISHVIFGVVMIMVIVCFSLMMAWEIYHVQ